MKKIELNEDINLGKYNKTKIASRGIIVESNRILLCYFKNLDLYGTPGGKLDNDESNIDACIREVKEETGKLVNISNFVIETIEYYNDLKYVNDYFICNIIGEREVHYTSKEKELNLETRWLDIDYYLNLVSKYNDYKDIDNSKYNIYKREYIVLKEVLPLIDRYKSNNINIKETKLGEGMRILKEQNSNIKSNDNICDTHWDGA